MGWYSDLIKKRLKHKDPVISYSEEYDDITDEIEKSLWEIKDSLDLPTEEIEISLESRRKALRYKSTHQKHG